MRTFLIAALVCATTAIALAQHKPTDVPVDYSANLNVVGAMGAAATSLMIHVNKYSTEKDRQKLLDALRTAGYQTFLPAFRKAPVVGYVQIKDRKWDLRWAQLQPSGTGTVLTAATDKPIYFLGGGDVDAKPRAGFEMAVIRLDVDSIGMGTGTFSAAARVKPNKDATSVEIDDYAGEPAKLTSVTRLFK
jgi:hypothetical protein